MSQTTDLIINIGVDGAIGIAVTICGSLLAIAWWAGNKFGELGAGIKGLDTRLTTMESLVSGLVQSKSPIGLTEKGTKALNDSGLKDFIDKNKDSLLSKCREKHEIKSAYDVQVAAFKYFDEIIFDEATLKNIKEFAFNEGASIDMIRRVGGIYFRDICLEVMKMSPKDLDKKSR